MSYAVVWSEPGGPQFAGSLELGRDSAVLSGTAGGSTSLRHLRLGSLVDVHLERGAGRAPVVVVAEVGGGRLEIASLEGCGVLHELADRLLGERGTSAR